MPLTLHILPGEYAVCRLAPEAAFPDWAGGEFVSVSRTADELSVVCAAAGIPAGVKHERGWRLLKFLGPFAFSQTGVLASVAGPLGAADVPIFVVSTFDTDYLLVKQDDLDRAASVLQKAGHTVMEKP